MPFLWQHRAELNSKFNYFYHCIGILKKDSRVSKRHVSLLGHDTLLNFQAFAGQELPSKPTSSFMKREGGWWDVCNLGLWLFPCFDTEAVNGIMGRARDDVVLVGCPAPLTWASEVARRVFLWWGPLSDSNNWSNEGNQQLPCHRMWSVSCFYACPISYHLTSPPFEFIVPYDSTLLFKILFININTFIKLFRDRLTTWMNNKNSFRRERKFVDHRDHSQSNQIYYLNDYPVKKKESKLQ